MKDTIESTLKNLGYVIRPIVGDSMMPMLNQATDTVKIVELKTPLKKYDLPLYKRPNGQYVLHRAIAVKKDYFIACGDNRWRSEKVPYEWIVGVTEGYFRSKEYTPCDDKQYIKYTKKACRGRFTRFLKAGFTRLFKGRKNPTPQKTAEISAEAELLLRVLRSAVGAEAVSAIPDGINIQRFLKLASSHSVSATAYCGLKNVTCPEELINPLKESFNLTLRRELLFNAERQKITEQFEERRVAFLPLKGVILKDLYPCHGMRRFADNDILIKDSDREVVKEVMLGLGYEKVSKTELGVHDVYQKKPIFDFEMHRKLFDEDIFEFAEYFDGVWERAVLDGDNEYAYRLTDDDFYVYNVAHFYKHYSQSGTGVRSLVDLYIMRKKLNLNREYLDAQLKAIGVLDFERKMGKLCESLFDGNSEEIDKDTLIYILNSKTYGTVTNNVANGMKNEGKIAWLFKRLFPSYKFMSKMYPVLQKAPILLPIYWVIRLVLMLFRSQSRKMFSASMKNIFDKEKRAEDATGTEPEK